MTEKTLTTVAEFWASRLGLPSETLFSEQHCIVLHGEHLKNYDGVFIMSRNDATIVSVPDDCPHDIRELLSEQPLSTANLISRLGSCEVTVVGPALLSYPVKSLTLKNPVGRSLTHHDTGAVGILCRACPDSEWEHGGSRVGRSPSFGVFVGDELVSLAGYEILGGRIAHIAVITHPAFRSRGFGRAAVSEIARLAHANDLIPQFQTLGSNAAAIQIAGSLGFEHFATSISIRFNRKAK